MDNTFRPHHASKEGKELRAKEEAERLAKEGLEPTQNVEGQDLASEQKVETPTNTQEATIPVSEVQRMIKEAMATIPTAQPQIQQPPVQYYQPKLDQDIEDLPEFKNWEVKDRIYEFVDKSRPISASIPWQHTELIPLQYTNTDSKTVHILRYSSNQPSFFIEKQSKEPGSVLRTEIIFEFGRLFVQANNITLQKFLHIHPYKEKLFTEYDPTASSRKVVNDKKVRHQAESYIYDNADVLNRAIASVLCEDYVDSWKEDILIERLLAESEKDAKKFIALCQDPSMKVKRIIKGALAKGDLIYENYRYMNSRREVVIEVGRNQDELDEMVKYLESGVGRTFYDFLQNR